MCSVFFFFFVSLLLSQRQTKNNIKGARQPCLSAHEVLVRIPWESVNGQFTSMLWLKRDVNSALVFILAAGCIKVKCLPSEELTVTHCDIGDRCLSIAATSGCLTKLCVRNSFSFLETFLISPSSPTQFNVIGMWIIEFESFFCNHRLILPISLWEEESPVLVSFKRKFVF